MRAVSSPNTRRFRAAKAFDPPPSVSLRIGLQTVSEPSENPYADHYDVEDQPNCEKVDGDGRKLVISYGSTEATSARMSLVLAINRLSKPEEYHFPNRTNYDNTPLSTKFARV